MPIEYTLDTLHRTIDSLIKERDALAAELAQFKDEALEWEKAHILAESRVKALEAALREIACGLMPVDSAADHHNRYELCAGRLCKIARDVLRSTETACDDSIQAPTHPRLGGWAPMPRLELHEQVRTVQRYLCRTFHE
ncbi:MAG TPA: hypothetical protein VGL34_25245 [Steroidobacteraceae bacterium]|jgi:hypothetical protein